MVRMEDSASVAVWLAFAYRPPDLSLRPIVNLIWMTEADAMSGRQPVTSSAMRQS